MKKRVIAFVIVFFVMIILGVVLVTQSEISPYGNAMESTSSASGQIDTTITNQAMDEHGCLHEAGYIWCENRQKCLREWEEACESTASIPINETDSTDNENSEPENPSDEGDTQVDLSFPENWKLYINNEYGFSFQFPSNCSLGPLGEECKGAAPEERSQDCLCFLNGENPDRVIFQTYTGTKPDLVLATMEIVHYNTELYNPPKGTELVPWVKEHFAFSNIPNEPNYDLTGTPALKIYSEGGPGVLSSENCLFIKNGRLYNITFLDVDNEDNAKIYNHILDSFMFMN